jgi:hypothetical protein
MSDGETLVRESPMTKIYNATEVLEVIVEFCDWGSLTAVGVTSSKLRIIRNRVIDRRVNHFLSLFIPEDDHERFFFLLKTTGSAVFGGVIRCMMSAGDTTFYDVYPHEMYIAVPFHPSSITTGSWRMLLGSVDYDILTDDDRRQAPECPTRRILHAKHVGVFNFISRT